MDGIQQRQRFTVISPFGQHQIDLPVDVPVAGFLPDLLTMAGLSPSPARLAGTQWQLADSAGRILAPHGTLAGQGMRPGAVIEVRGTRPPGQREVTDGQTQGGAGRTGITGSDTLVSRHVPRTAAPSAPPSDGLTPLQRVDAVLPGKVGRANRLLAAGEAFIRRPGWPVRDSEAMGGQQPQPDDPASDALLVAAGAPAGEQAAGGPDITAIAAPAPPAGSAAQQPASAAPSATMPSGRHRPGGKHRLLPADLTIAARPTRIESARARWRELDHVGQLDTRITEPRLQHCTTIAVVSPKGGVGKTTVTALLGTLFSLLRRDPIVAVDTNPDFGSLGRVLTPDQSWYVDDLARLVAEDDELSLTGLDSQLGRAVHGLLVVPAPTDPERMAALDEQAYRRVITRLKDFFSLILLDCGTGLQDPASAAAIATADQVVLLTDAQPATASLVAESADLLHQWGRPMTIVVNRMPPRGGRLDLQRLSRYLPAARGLVVIPDDITAASRLAVGSFSWRDAPPPWQLAVRRLAVVLVSDWARLGLAR